MPEFLKLSWHVAFRHLTVYRMNLFANVSPAVMEPLLFFAAFGIGLGNYVTDVREMSYLQFMAPGLSVGAAMFTAYFELSYGFYFRMKFENIYKAILTTPVGPWEIIMGEFIWVGIKGAIMTTGVALMLSLFGAVQLEQIWMIPLVGIAVAVPCGAVGLVSATYIRNMNQFQTVYSFLISPMYFLSGIFYPIEDMDGWIQTIAYCLPLAHGVRIGQEVLWNRPVIPVLVEHGIPLLGITLIFVWFAGRRVHPRLHD